ncbi:hypothetical protein ACPA0F_07875 [Solibacillus silvestris]
MRELPVWQNPGEEPSLTQSVKGWLPGQKPAAQHLNWFMNRTYLSLQEGQAHLKESTLTREGAHDFRYRQGTVSVRTNGVWTPVYSEGTPVSPVSDSKAYSVQSFKATADGNNVILTWKTPPGDFYKVIIRYALSSDGNPTSIYSGLPAYDGSSETATVFNLEKGKTYYFKAFSIDKGGNYNPNFTSFAFLTIPK